MYRRIVEVASDEIEGIALVAGVKTPQGRVYSRYQLEHAAEDIRNRINNSPVCGEFREPINFASIDLCNVCHRLTDVRLVGDELKVIAKLDGRMSPNIRYALLHDNPFYFWIRGTGWVNDHGEVSNLHFITFDLRDPDENFLLGEHKAPYVDEPLWF